MPPSGTPIYPNLGVCMFTQGMHDTQYGLCGAEISINSTTTWLDILSWCTNYCDSVIWRSMKEGFMQDFCLGKMGHLARHVNMYVPDGKKWDLCTNEFPLNTYYSCMKSSCTSNVSWRGAPDLHSRICTCVYTSCTS